MVNRWRIAGALLGLAFGTALRVGDAQTTDLDLLIKGGRVIDAKNAINRVLDIGIRQGKIAQSGGIWVTSMSAVSPIYPY